jgi:hypothetical protein
MEAAEADMLNLPFGNESFDVVIEKGAMVGSILTRSQSLPYSPFLSHIMIFQNWSLALCGITLTLVA